MKNLKKMLSLSVFLFTINGITAQNSISLVTGIHQSNIKANGINIDFLNFDPITSFHAGVIYERALNASVSARSGLIFTRKGFGINESFGVDVLGIEVPLGVSIETKIKTIDVPLSLKYNLIQNNIITPYILGGVNVSYASDAKLKTKAKSIFDFTISNIDIDLSNSAFNRWTAEANVAAGMKWDKDNSFYTAELAYTHALNDFTNENSTFIDAGIRNYTFNFTVGYGIRF